MIRSLRHKRHTLSGKLIFLFIVMSVLMVVIIGSIIGWSFRNHFEENIRPHLTQYLEYIHADIGIPPDQQKAEAIAQKLSVEIHYFSDKQQWSTTDRLVDLEELRFHRQFSQAGVEYGFGHAYDREYLISYYDNYTLAFSVAHKRQHFLYKVIPVLVILMALVLLYHATRRLFAPINDIKQGINRIGSGELNYRLDIKRNDELGDLGSSINAMADDIEQMLEAKRQLLLAISHELRSPLTRAKVAVELLHDAKQRGEIHQDLNEMEKLIEELLETERLNSRHSKLNKSKTILQTIVKQVLDEHFLQNDFTLHIPSEPIELEVDQARIKLLLRNVLENAKAHNPDQATSPTVQATQQGTLIKIIVRDAGPGIEVQHIPHLTEPFYRTDKARQRKTGGYGLGLYLCKVIIEAHGGELKIDSELGKGTTVTIILPCEKA